MTQKITLIIFGLVTSIFADTNFLITSFQGGELSWTNADPSLFYTVEWKSSLTSSNGWKGSFEECQDIQSSDQIVKVPVPVYFRVTGTETSRYTKAFPVSIPKTGQTVSYAAGDDGDLQKGVEWPSPRFVDNGNGTVLDNLTGLVWLKHATPFGGSRTWATALVDCNTLNSGEQLLSDGSVEGDWRLPNRLELETLLDFSKYEPPNFPFIVVQNHVYWTSTTVATHPDRAWSIDMSDGNVGGGIVWDIKSKTDDTIFVWPVRDRK